jgi:hypothetical protein
MIVIRLATESDRPALAQLIPASARELSRGYYSDTQTESAIAHVFGADSRLIADGTYFAAEEDGRLVGCGGWSRRRTLYGGDQMKAPEDPLLDPSTEPARIRAFFVHPDCARGVAPVLQVPDAARKAASGGSRRVDASGRRSPARWVSGSGLLDTVA